MLQPDSLRTAFEIAADRTAITTVDARSGNLSPQEPQHIGTVQAEHSVTNQSGIQPGQIVRRAKHQIGGPLALIDRPVIIHRKAGGNLPVRRMHAAAKRIQQSRPVLRQLIVQQTLSPPHVLDPGEAIVPPHITDAGPVQFAGQPLPTVEHDVNREWEPGLQPHMQQSQLPMPEVEVVMQTLPLAQMQPQSLQARVPADRERAARLDTTEHGDQPLVTGMRSQHVPDVLFLADSRGRKVTDLAHRRLAGQPFADRPDPLGDGSHEGVKLLEQDLIVPKKLAHPALRGEQQQRAAKPQAIKPAEDSHKTIVKPLDKLLHGVVVGRWCLRL